MVSKWVCQCWELPVLRKCPNTHSAVAQEFLALACTLWEKWVSAWDWNPVAPNCDNVSIKNQLGLILEQELLLVILFSCEGQVWEKLSIYMHMSLFLKKNPICSPDHNLYWCPGFWLFLVCLFLASIYWQLFSVHLSMQSRISNALCSW